MTVELIAAARNAGCTLALMALRRCMAYDPDNRLWERASNRSISSQDAERRSCANSVNRVLGVRWLQFTRSSDCTCICTSQKGHACTTATRAQIDAHKHTQ